MKLKIDIELEYDEDFVDMGDFRWEVKETIKRNILEAIMSRQQTKDFVDKKINEVLGELNVGKD